jgi:hypothetical protein
MVETINAILHTFHSPRFKPWAIGIRETTKGCAIIEKDSIAHLRRAMKFFVYSCYRYLPPTAAFLHSHKVWDNLLIGYCKPYRINF